MVAAVESDPALAIGVLRLANGPRLRKRGPVTSISAAVEVLGRAPLATETEIIRGLAEGKVYKAIASDLGLSTSTVRTHLHNTYGKLGAVDRAQAVLIATERGWL